MRGTFRMLSCGFVFKATIFGVAANQHDAENVELLSEAVSHEVVAADNLTRQTFARRLITVGDGTASFKVGPGLGWDGGDNKALYDGGDTYCYWYKCSQCQGDCDSDAQCNYGLKCYQRWWKEPIPNCQSGGSNDNPTDDFCYKPHTKKLAYISTSWCSSWNKCGQCYGDCDTDADCQVGTQCFERSLLSKAEVPGCVGSAGGNSANDYTGKDYCVLVHSAYTPSPTPLRRRRWRRRRDRRRRRHRRRRDRRRRRHRRRRAALGWDGGANTDLYEGGSSYCKSWSKCAACQGDCDSDAQCAAGLKCWHRTFGESVPNCGVGGVYDKMDSDYCYKPWTTPLKYIRECSPSRACNHCEGDCDSDAHCKFGLRCFERSGTTEVPGCVNEGSGDHWGYDYCIKSNVPKQWWESR